MQKKTRWWGKRPGLFTNNIRFYILVFTVLYSIAAACYLRTVIASDTLFQIRVQQVYGFSALLYWYFALLATPLSTIFGKQGFMQHYLYSRRALGVSAAYLASLHVLISLFGPLGGLRGIWLLPDQFQLAMIFGAIALLFLLLMAFTSFDKVVAWMTFPRWKWLHRLGYIAAILVFLHIWMLGTHIEYAWVRWSLFGALALLASLESWRGSLQLQKRMPELGRPAFYCLFISLAALCLTLLLILPTTVDRYHDDHANVSHGDAH